MYLHFKGDKFLILLNRSYLTCFVTVFSQCATAACLSVVQMDIHNNLTVLQLMDVKIVSGLLGSVMNSTALGIYSQMLDSFPDSGVDSQKWNYPL